MSSHCGLERESVRGAWSYTRDPCTAGVFASMVSPARTGRAEVLLFKLILWCPVRLAVMTAGLLACACSQPPEDSPQQQIQERLVGTWLREYQEDGARVRRVLELDSDGHFREHTIVTGSAGAVADHAHAGEWRFDGTNLKRRYTQMDGKQPSAPIVPFATFEIRFESPDELVGIDRVHQRQVHYRRVVDGTTP
jgi:hypothetical protein